MGKIKIGKLLIDHGKTNITLLHQRNKKLNNHLQKLFTLRKPELTSREEDFIIESGMEQLHEQRELEKMEQNIYDENEYKLL